MQRYTTRVRTNTRNVYANIILHLGQVCWTVLPYAALVRFWFEIVSNYSDFSTRNRLVRVGWDGRSEVEQGSWEQGLGTRTGSSIQGQKSTDYWRRTRDHGTRHHGPMKLTREHAPCTRQQGLGTKGPGPRTMDHGPGTKDWGRPLL